MTSRNKSAWPSARIACAAAAFLAAFLAVSGPAFSQQSPPGREIFYSKIQPLTDEIEQVKTDPRPSNAGNSLQALDWLIYGDLTVGGVYDSNVFSSKNNNKAVYGTRFQPAILAERNTGIQRTLAYGTADIRYYPSISEVDLVNTSGGLVHVWEIQRDFVFRTQGEVTRGRSASLNLLNPGTTYTEPVDYTSLFGSASIEKTFGRFFTALGGSVTRNDFQDTKNSLGVVVPEAYRSGTLTVLSTRLGYHLTPLVYTFVEPSLNWAQYNASNLDTHGEQIKVGLGTARIGLFNGEVYGGYLSQKFYDPAIDPLTQMIYGGQISYFPTRFLTFSASTGQSIANSDFSPTAGLGTVTKVNTSRLSASWGVTRDVTLAARFQFDRSEYLNTPRIDDKPEYGLTVTYSLTPRFAVVVDYSHTKVTSNIAGAGYERDLVSIGGKTSF